MAEVDALCYAVVRMLAASANNLQLNMLMLEDDSATPVRHILAMTLREGSAGDPDADPVEPPYCRIVAQKVLPTGSASFTPVKVYPIGNLGDYQCNSEADLLNILGEGDFQAAHPTLAEVTVGPVYDIPEEDRITYESGYTMGWSYQLDCTAAIESGS
jgi:hypothetical protein